MKNGMKYSNSPVNPAAKVPALQAVNHRQFESVQDYQMGSGTAWSGHLPCKEESSGIRFPEGPPNAGIV